MAPSPYISTTMEAGSHIQNLARAIMTRDSESEPDHKTTILLIVLGLCAFFLGSVTAFITYRRRQRNLHRMREDALNDYQEAKLGMYESTTNLNGLTIETKHNGRASTILIRRDSNPMLANPNSPPNSPDNVPEIHITVPDEVDEKGQLRGPRVLVVRVGENATVGLEPMGEEQLPPYQKDDKNGFYSVDMDQIGGLKEKDRTQFQ